VPNTTPAYTRTHFYNPPTGTRNSNHKVKFVRSATSRHPRAATKPVNWWRVTIVGVTDEQGVTANFVSKDNAVLGGGLVQVIDAVSCAYINPLCRLLKTEKMKPWHCGGITDVVLKCHTHAPKRGS
jgi:hypothetical protein